MQQPAANQDQAEKPTSKPIDFQTAISGRQSPELVIALSGPVGCGHQKVIGLLDSKLQSLNYETHTIKISDHLKGAIRKGIVEISEEIPVTRKNYSELQKAGNKLREDNGDSILAQIAANEVALIRNKDKEKIGLTEKPEKRAYFIDQLKHPAEVKLLRMIYGDLFYLIGVYSSSTERKSNIMERGLTEDQALEVMIHDKHENEDSGQKLDKTLFLADYFVRNAYDESLDGALQRFVQLVHGATGQTPTSSEYGMYAAFGAAFRSACLSRQVGAAILDAEGNLLSTGTNDVPNYGGGLYQSRTDGSQNADNRCFKMNGGMCFNDHHKKRLVADIESVLDRESDLNKDEVKSVEKSIHRSTGVGNLIEYSRSIHAEMDAIISVARAGARSIVGSQLYTTTFPCHNCARHIVAAGISEVYFIEPYEKSLALQLHCDSIEFDALEIQDQHDGTEEQLKTPHDNGLAPKVRFLYFEGVAPRKYECFFNPPHDKKDDDGIAVFPVLEEAKTVGAQYLDSYLLYEAKIAEQLEKKHLADLNVSD